MEDILAKTPMWIKVLPSIFTGLVVIATVVVRFTKSQADDKLVGKLRGYVLYILHRFPTIGLNPLTKEMEETLQVIGTVENDQDDNSDS